MTNNEMVKLGGLGRKHSISKTFFLVLAIVAVALATCLAAAIFIATLSMAFLLLFFRSTRFYAFRVVHAPLTLISHAWSVRNGWTHVFRGETRKLIDSLRRHSERLGVDEINGEMKIGYAVGGTSLREFKLPVRAIEQGLLVSGHYAEEIADIILSNIRGKTIVIGRGRIPISYRDRRVRYITIGGRRQFNPFEFDGGDSSSALKRWAESLAAAIGVSSTLQTSHFDALNAYFISTASTVSPDHFATLDWVDDIDGYTSVSDAFDVKNALRTLLLRLDSVSGRGDVTMRSIRQLLNDVDIVYLNLGELDDRAYKFISSFTLLSSKNGFQDVTLVIYDFNLLAPPIRSLEYQHLPLWRMVMDAVKRGNIVLVSRSALIASQLYTAMPNVIASSLHEYEGMRALGGRVLRRKRGGEAVDEKILSELHEQEAIACIGPSVAVFAFQPGETTQAPEEAVATTEAQPSERARKTVLWRDFKDKAEKASNILGYVKFQGMILHGDLEREYPESSQLISQLIQEGYLTSIEGKTIIHAKGEYAMKEWNKATNKKGEGRTRPITQPIVQPQLEAFKERIPPVTQDLGNLLERAEKKLSVGANSAAVRAAYMFIYRSLKHVAGLPTANLDELTNALRARGYMVNRSEVSRAKAMFINTRKGKGVAEEDARACVEIAKRIASLLQGSTDEE